MAEERPLGERAYDHLQHLALEIGPRPAGSPAERQALDYIHDRLQSWGYKVERQTAPFAPSRGFLWPYTLGGIALIVSSWLITPFPWLVVVLPLLVAVLPQLSMIAISKRPRTKESGNVIAYTQVNSQEAPTLLLCAHVDSAPADPFRSPTLSGLYGRRMDIIYRVVIALAALGALNALGLNIPPALLVLAGMLGSLAGIWLLSVEIWRVGVRTKKYTPGALDNASGVGVVLTLAEHYAEAAPNRVRMGFLFTGAEETGMHGADAYAQELSSHGENFWVLGIDQVGAGSTLNYVTKDGVLFPIRTDDRLNQLVRLVHDRAQPIRHTLRSGDYAAFIRHGFPATTLQTSGTARADAAYHTLDDTTALVEIHTLDMVAQTVVKMVEASWAYLE